MALLLPTILVSLIEIYALQRSARPKLSGSDRNTLTGFL